MVRPLPVLEHAALANDDEVLRALVRRRDTGWSNHWFSENSDRRRIALVVGGGGMRGAYAGGMVHALADAGLAGVFDVVYGSSAGAFVGAGFLLGQAAGSAAIFHEDMACRAFIDPRRFGRRKPVVSLDHLLERVLVDSKPLAWERLRDATTPLRVVATAADDLTGHVLTPGTVEEWKLAMRATATIPLLAGGPVELHGRRWVDGSIAEPLPVLRALNDGATHVLALINRSIPELRRVRRDGPVRWAQALDRLAPGLGTMADETRRHHTLLAMLDDAGHPSRTGRHLMTLAPVHGLGVRGLTTDVPRVQEAARRGYRAVVTALARATA